MKAIFRTLLAAVLCMATPHALAQGFVVNLSDGSQMLFPLSSVSNVSIYGTGQEQISVSASSLTLNADDAMKTVTVTTNVFAYAVSVSESWLTVTTAVSTSGNKYISVGAEPDHGTTARTATITLTAGAATATVNVTQNGATVSATKSFTVTGNGKTVTFNMKLVEAGTFQMGSDAADAFDWEKPVHSVTLTKDYYMGETEVTQALWYAVMGQNPTSDGSQWESTYGLGDSNPAYYVSWNDCQTFISKLNALTGVTFRLPTEAEWEFAAKGGNKSQGYTYAGSNKLGDVAWYSGNSSSKTHEVATKAPNELGLYDMSGNVWEWCQDLYGSYSSSAQTDPTGPTSGSLRVLRGGSWDSDAANCRVADRGWTYATYRSGNLGFRLGL